MIEDNPWIQTLAAKKKSNHRERSRSPSHMSHSEEASSRRSDRDHERAKKRDEDGSQSSKSRSHREGTSHANSEATLLRRVKEMEELLSDPDVQAVVSKKAINNSKESHFEDYVKESRLGDPLLFAKEYLHERGIIGPDSSGNAVFLEPYILASSTIPRAESSMKEKEAAVADSKKKEKQETCKLGDKSVKLPYYDGKDDDITKILTFIREFDLAFKNRNYSKESKLHQVTIHLKEVASNWYSTLVTRNTDPKTWEEFKETFGAQFLPTDFRKKVCIEWDKLDQQGDNVQKYITQFWDAFLKAAQYIDISDTEVIRKFEGGLNPLLQPLMHVSLKDTLKHCMESALNAEARDMKWMLKKKGSTTEDPKKAKNEERYGKKP